MNATGFGSFWALRIEKISASVSKDLALSNSRFALFVDFFLKVDSIIFEMVSNKSLDGKKGGVDAERPLEEATKSAIFRAGTTKKRKIGKDLREVGVGNVPDVRIHDHVLRHLLKLQHAAGGGQLAAIGGQPRDVGDGALVLARVATGERKQDAVRESKE